MSNKLLFLQKNIDFSDMTKKNSNFAKNKLYENGKEDIIH